MAWDQKKDKGAGVVAAVILICGALAMCVSASNRAQEERDRLSTREGRQAEFCRADKGYLAYAYAQNTVRDRLKAPATADFAEHSENYLGGCSWNVFGKVDAENSFGAKLRNVFTVQMTYDPQGDRWLSENFVMRP